MYMLLYSDEGGPFLAVNKAFEDTFMPAGCMCESSRGQVWMRWCIIMMSEPGRRLAASTPDWGMDSVHRMISRHLNAFLARMSWIDARRWSYTLHVGTMLKLTYPSAPHLPHRRPNDAGEGHRAGVPAPRVRILSSFKCLCACMDLWMHESMDGWMDGWMDVAVCVLPARHTHTVAWQRRMQQQHHR